MPSTDQIGDLGVAAAERDDDDDYNPEEDSSDSEGGRRGRKARLAKQQAAAAAAVSSQAPWDPTLGELTMVRKRGRPPGSGRGGRGGSASGPGLTWSGAGGRGGRGAASAIFATPSGVAWNADQVLQQQNIHLDNLQRAMAQAMASGNEPLLQQLKTGGIGGKVLPTPLPLVRGRTPCLEIGCRGCLIWCLEYNEAGGSFALATSVPSVIVLAGC